MNNIFYNITSASLSWNPFIHFLHTIHIIPAPDIVTGWHILCLIYFSCTIQVLIKQQNRSSHSWCHYTNFQKGAVSLSSLLQSDHLALSLTTRPSSSRATRAEPSPPPVCALGTLPVCNGFITSHHYQTAQFPSQLSPLKLGTFIGQVWTQRCKYSYVPLKWINIIFYILKSPSYNIHAQKSTF